MSNIRDFITHIRRHGIAPVNRYRLTFGIPNNLNEKIIADPTGSFADGMVRNPPTFTQMPDSTSQSGRSLSLMAQSVSVPGYNIQTTDLRASSLLRRFPVGKSFGELDVTFMSAGNMNERKYFDEWVKFIVNDKNQVAFYDDIITDVTLEVQDANDNTIYRTNILEVYPTVVTPISLDRSATNAIQTFQVTFNFWKVETNDDVVSRINPMTGEMEPAPVIQERTIFGIPTSTIKQGTGLWKQVEAIKREIERGDIDAKSAIRILRRLREDIGLNVLETAPEEGIRDIEDLIWVLQR